MATSHHAGHRIHGRDRQWGSTGDRRRPSIRATADNSSCRDLPSASHRAEAIYLPAVPATPIQNLRAACRRAITTTRTIDPDSRPYRPHVSIAYVNGESPTDRIAQALTMTDTDAIEVTISHVSLMVFHRDRRMYEWTKAIHIPIGDNPA
ncbi:2'-5' RNA ligase family protein [Nonomuraea sp. NPDC049714]|uniref:2'-5' RNA ligase family protein n=1 Tax=Nonomuraea sp. NPDC049714 TaxID=3364357 RepID=UPI00378929CB